MNDHEISDSASMTVPPAARTAAVRLSSWGLMWASRTVAEELAAGLRRPFEDDKDDKALYPEVNIAKMHAGIPSIRRLAASVKIDESATPAWSP